MYRKIKRMEKLVKIKNCKDLIKVKLFYCPVKPDKPHKLSDGTVLFLIEIYGNTS